MKRAPIDRAPYVSLTGLLLEVKMEAYTLVFAPAGMWSQALYFFRCACSSLPANTCKAASARSVPEV
jgi:hypothetical protein